MISVERCACTHGLFLMDDGTRHAKRHDAMDRGWHDGIVTREISLSVTHRVISRSAIDVGHTPRDISTTCPPSMSVTNCVIYLGVLVTSGLSRGPSHTACPPSMLVTNCVIYRGVLVTSRLSHGPSHTACPSSMLVTNRVIYRNVSVTYGLSHGPSHTTCLPLMLVTNRVIYRSVSVTDRDQTRSFSVPVRSRGLLLINQ